MARALKENGANPFVSIIIVNYEGANFIEKCLSSILKTRYKDFEVVVVDNGSSDESLNKIKKFTDPKIKLVTLSSNVGFAGGNNIGLSHASGDILALLNNDTEVTENWLYEAVSRLIQNEKIALVQSRLIFMHDRATVESDGAFVDRLGYGFELGFYNCQIRSSVFRDIFYANGAAILLRKSALLDLYPFSRPIIFDESFFMTYEDVDLSWLLRLKGYRIINCPSSVVYHYRSRTSSKNPPKMVFHHSKNRLMTLCKNYEIQNLAKYLPLLITFETLRALIHIGKGRTNLGLAIFKAFLWNIVHIREVWKRRRFVSAKVRVIKDIDLFGLMYKVNPSKLLENYRLYNSFSKNSGVNITR